ncbi:uncharacterized protein ColSpa_04428 [Colletotrichum spaethianum]|uniref:Uncharacterized protein n=1 Tax=Colletotrichum spaethianum TaxID=700344 RepID=A0AA37LHL1_9PEZI|nr:uncharacterized protein ColSpa_04428 [Colletotrichum spaethianum]GKT44247.1 hypothetical protein ColSpa_04428 [Colletotrichum spaethianum]
MSVSGDLSTLMWIGGFAGLVTKEASETTESAEPNGQTAPPLAVHGADSGPDLQDTSGID